MQLKRCMRTMSCPIKSHSTSNKCSATPHSAPADTASVYTRLRNWIYAVSLHGQIAELTTCFTETQRTSSRQHSHHVDRMTHLNSAVEAHGWVHNLLRERSVTTCVFASVDLPAYMWTTEYAIVYRHATTSLHMEKLLCMSSMLVVGQRNARCVVATVTTLETSTLHFPSKAWPSLSYARTSCRMFQHL
jgi:hypothetical protein